MNKPIYSFTGKGGQLEVYHDKVVIKRKGFVAKMTQGIYVGDKSIYIQQISSIIVKNGDWLSIGYIQFVLAGNQERDFRKKLTAGIHDENTIFFNKKDNDTIEKIKSAIEELMAKDHSSLSGSEADEIKKYKQLLDDGIITQEEFTVKKKQLLGM